MQPPRSALLVTAALVPSLSAQTLGPAQPLGNAAARGELRFTPLVQEGELVAGVGNVTSISNFAVNDAGSWIVEAATNAVSTANDVVIRDGALYLTEGDLLAEPAGAGLNTFDAITLNDAGDSGWNFFLENTAGTNDDSGVYWNTGLLIQEGSLSTATGFGGPTPYRGFFETKVNEAGQVLLLATVDDPLVASTVDQALVLLGVDGSGNLSSETRLAGEGDLLSGQSELVATFGTSSHNLDLDATGRVMFVADLEGGTTTDVVAYLDGTPVAQEGSPSPAVGRNWSLSSSSTAVALNDAGQWALRGGLDGDAASNTLVVVDGVPLVQEGDVLPAIAPFALTSFGTGPIRLGNDGSVLWFGQWSDPDTTRNKALFVDHEILVQEGVTRLDGKLVDTLRGISDGYTMSDSGLYVVFEAILEDGTEGAWMATRPYVRR